MLLTMMMLLTVLGGRLAWLQMIDTGSFSRRHIDLAAAAVAQREQGIELDSGRGQLYDRHGVPLTGMPMLALAVFPVHAALASDMQRSIAAVLGVPEESWRSFCSGLTTPRLWTDPATGQPKPLDAEQARQLRELSLPGIEVVETVRRYRPDGLARHAIGFLAQQPLRAEREYASQLAQGTMTRATPIGAAGLEKTMEAYLLGAGKTSLSLFTDAVGRPLPGMNLRLVQPGNPYYPLQVHTTLDAGLQRSAELALDKAGIASGAIVVLDADNADVLAMASRPDYDPYRIVAGEEHWGNKAVKALTPGSIFKTAVAAAALEEGVVAPGETFECNGALGKYGFTCWLHGGHGTLSLEEAYAQSCNVVFAKVMQRLSAESLQRVSHQLGLDRQVGWASSPSEPGGSVWRQLDGEEHGQLFAGREPNEDEGVRVQTAIGQRDVLMSPLQAANLVVTLLHDGQVMSPRLVKEVRFRTGGLAERFSPQVLVERQDGVSARTLRKLSRWMLGTVQRGTGKALRQAEWTLAGKSGTADTTIAGRAAVHQWFIGYGPAERPRYAVAVVAAHEPGNGPNRAIAAFRAVMDALAEAEKPHMPGGK